MSKLYIKAPDGRIVPAPRSVTVSKIVDGAPVAFVNPAALKDGWSIASAVDLAALKAEQVAVEQAAEKAAKEAAAKEARLTAALAVLAADPTSKPAKAEKAS